MKGGFGSPSFYVGITHSTGNFMTQETNQSVEVALSAITPSMLVYVAAPYSAKNEDGGEDLITVHNRMRDVCLCMNKLMRRGIKPISPLTMHLLRTYDPKLPGDWAYWGAYSELMLNNCDVMIVLMIDGWKESVGVTAEIELAKATDKPIIYIEVSELLTEPE